MKGYCLNVKGFSLDEKLMVVKALSRLTGCANKLPLKCYHSTIGNVSSTGKVSNTLSFSDRSPTHFQKPYLCSYYDVVKESGLDYFEDPEDQECKQDKLKGYCVDVRGFSAEKKKLVSDAIDDLCGYDSSRIKLETIENYKSANYITNILSTSAIDYYSSFYRNVTPEQIQYEITFENLMDLHLRYVSSKCSKELASNETTELSSSRAIAMFYSKEQEINELKSKIEELKEECKRLEDSRSDLESLCKEFRSLFSSKAAKEVKLKDELVWYKTATFSVSLITFSYFFVKALLLL